jgi:predicted histidine transporter YuiF (NhaC family)
VSGDIGYWSFVGIGFVVTLGVGMLLMRKTNRVAFSFSFSTLINFVVFAAASVWWFGKTGDSLQRTIGLMFYLIAFVNVAAFDFFALVSMRKHSGPGENGSESA